MLVEAASAGGTFFECLYPRPLVVAHAEYERGTLEAMLPAPPVIRFISYSWHRPPDQVLEFDARMKTERPEDTVIHLVNDRCVADELENYEIESVFMPSYIFVDETTFVPRTPDHVPSFRAVYNARFTPWKRHSLAAEVDRLLLIGGVVCQDDSSAYFSEIREAIPSGIFTHHPYNEALTPDQVAANLQDSRVGLCLSEVEGAMFACAEYLLAGLPVVTTESLGGRAWWLDPDFSRVVAPDTASVRAAVDDLIDLDIDPWLVRRRTLQRLVTLRTKFCQLAQRHLDNADAAADFSRSFYGNLNPKMFRWRRNQVIMQMIDDAIDSGRC